MLPEEREMTVCLSCGEKDVCDASRIYLACDNCGKDGVDNFITLKDILQRTKIFKRALHIFATTPVAFKKTFLNSQVAGFVIINEEIIDKKETEKSELKFDIDKFRYDLLAYRMGTLKMGRRPFAKLVGEKSNGSTINHIECDKIMPRLDLFWNICKIIEKDPAIYFI